MSIQENINKTLQATIDNIEQSIQPGMPLHEMSKYQQFVLWSKTSDGRKLPINPKTLNMARVTNTADMGTVYECLEKAKQKPVYGIGFVFTSNDPFFFLDIDKAHDGKDWSDVAKSMCKSFEGAFVEVSQSNTGLHIIGKTSAIEHSCKNADEGIELYTKERFVALTGEGANGDACLNFSVQLREIVEIYFPPNGATRSSINLTDKPRDDWNGFEDDNELLKKAMKSQNARSMLGTGCSFADLFNKDVTKLGVAYPDSYKDRPYDESSADAALAQQLAFWTGCHGERIERFMRMSALQRPKWDKNRSYLARTISKACANQKDVHQKRGDKPDHDDWGELITEKKVEAEPFDLDKIIPESCSQFKEFIQACATSFQVANEMLLLPALSLISLALSGVVKTKIKEDWKESTPIWSVVMAQSGERKSPVLDKLVRPIQEAERKYKEDNKLLFKQLSRKKELLKSSIESLKTKLEKAYIDKKNDNVKEFEERINEFEKELSSIPDYSENPKLIQSDITPEALVKQTFVNGGYCGVVSAEADPIKVALGLYNSNKANFPIYLKGYSNEPYSSTRIGRESIEIENTHIALSVLLQPRYLQELSENEEAMSSGFVARVLFSNPSSKLGGRTMSSKDVPQELNEWWSRLINNLMSLPRKNWAYQGSVYQNKEAFIELESDAAQRFEEIFNRIEKMHAESGEFHGDGSWASKLPGNLIRIATCFHFISGKSVRDKISLEIVECVSNFINPLVSHYFSILREKNLKLTPRIKNALRVLNEKGVFSQNKATQRELFSKLRNKKDNKVTAWEDVFQTFEELNLIRRSAGERGSVVYEFHPQINEVFNN